MQLGADGNDIRQTNVPDIRLKYRHEIWRAEMDQVLFSDASGGEDAKQRMKERKKGTHTVSINTEMSIGK